MKNTQLSLVLPFSKRNNSAFIPPSTIFEYHIPNNFNEYLLIISPPEHIKQDVKKLKKWLAKYIGSFASHYSIAHITIASFLMHKKDEPALLKSLSVSASQENAIVFTIDNFNNFPPVE